MPENMIHPGRKVPTRPGFAPTLIGMYLSQVRSLRQLSRAEVARRMGISVSEVGAWERGSPRLASRSNIGRYLDACGVHDRRLVQTLARMLPGGVASASPSVFWDDGPGNADRAALLMTRAEAVQCFTSDRIPEPFQTEGYAAAWPVHRLLATCAGPKGLEIPYPRAGVGTKRWTLVLDEAVLGRTRGRPAMMAEQLGHLLELSRAPHVEVRVLRLDAALALPVAFLAGHRLADQGTLWRQDGYTYTDADAHEKRGLMFSRALRHTVGVEESWELIAKAREGMRLVARAMKPVPGAAAQ
ncbi:Scr1 family TA system antitoxin-like transcriptional regulator [Streptomyces cinereoruber]|uniref:Scr1 family TA system antitoxin-like transcriptional regulator n=1 Tax=Streptomyces cinereoruber TaxID=67260 RepID=UPI00362E6C35